MKRHHINPDQCIACTVCVAHCPVTAATNKFRGPRMVGPALERMRLLQDDYDSSLDYCTNCKNCDISCPSGVPISTLNMLARTAYYKKRKPKLRDLILSHGERMGKLSEAFPAALTNMGMAIGRRLGMMDWIGLSSKAPIPSYAAESFMKQFKNLRQQSYPDKVVFFVGCYINFNDPQVGMDIVAVMQTNQYEVIVADDFVCCGSPLIVNGFFSEAEQNACQNTQVLKKWIDQGYPVITGCTSCLLMLKQEYQELFGIEQMSKNAKHLYDASEFLLKLHDEGRLNTHFGIRNDQYLYHAPCHLRAQGIGLPALDLLEMVPGLSVEDIDAGCCGISGSYGLKADKYEIAMTIGNKLFTKIKASNKKAVLSECGTCRLQIGHGSGAETIHPISLVRKAYERK
ncbi:Anaerobic glycerol-3-phosphate dehydrogenase subunit C [bioreactor metagenome]|uniref:Anaerobic glycerol-3-phosphate dehydrogenase subunit C n=1 Tax=bioreactor metagenome TaxID=1076179 RepID=A0A644TQ30_9ZZZZ|nr:anaerobic glycerol-3-phosphate dehydrogenase subunit C [Negativicutes bacterium]